jgi:hypothetical protein
VGRLGERYWSWIHEPIDSPLRLFKSDVCEYLSCNNWYMIPIVWMPVIVALLFIEYTRMVDVIADAGSTCHNEYEC